MWKCPDCCASLRKGGDNSTTPIRSVSDNVTKRKKTDTHVDINTTSEVKDLIEEMRTLTREISSLKIQLESTTTTLNKCQTKLDELVSTVALHDDRLNHLENRDQQINLLESKVTELQQELNVQEQHHLRNELELSGIPELASENLHHIALLAARKVGVDLSDSDIDWVTRVGPRIKSALNAEHNVKFSRPVVIRLLRRSQRDQLIKASKSRKNITSADFDIPGTSNKIYFNERLTKQNRLLFRAARAKSKEYDYSFCWCTQGVIYVKQREGKPSLPVRTHADLCRIFNSSGN